MPRIIMNRGFIARWTRMPHSTGRLSASVSSHHSLSSAAFITNIAESDFRHAQGGLFAFLDVAQPRHPFLPSIWYACWPVLSRGNYCSGAQQGREIGDRLDDGPRLKAQLLGN